MRGETYIYFTGQYWVALFSEEECGKITRVGKVIFGEEPSSAIFDEWLAKGSPGLIMLKASDSVQSNQPRVKNPKRAMREVKKLSLASEKKETKSQLAFNNTLEDLKAKSKQERKARSKEIKQDLFVLKQKKNKLKKRGK